MSTSTDLSTPDDGPGTFLALNRPLGEIQEILADTLAGAELGEFDLPRVKIPSGGATTWEIPTASGTESSKQLTGVLVGFKRTRAYWTNPDPSGEPPVCRSDDAIIGIGDPGGPCKTCPYSQFGSSPKSDGAQACKEREIWFMLRPGSFLPLALALPATSLKGAKQYRINLASEGIRLPDVITSVTLRAEKNGKGNPYGIAVPVLASKLSDKEALAARAYAAELRPIFEAAAAAMTDEAPSTGAPVNADIAA